MFADRNIMLNELNNFKYITLQLYDNHLVKTFTCVMLDSPIM